MFDMIQKTISFIPEVHEKLVKNWKIYNEENNINLNFSQYISLQLQS